MPRPTADEVQAYLADTFGKYEDTTPGTRILDTFHLAEELMDALKSKGWVIADRRDVDYI
jgi:hypothetical protein